MACAGSQAASIIAYGPIRIPSPEVSEEMFAHFVVTSKQDRVPSGRTSVAVLDARDDVAAAVALDLETHLVARTQGLERCRILDEENAYAAFQKELRDRPELQGDPACRAIDGDDATRRQRLVG